ncbi:MAG: CHAP domain-containing protein [Ruminococcus sp.]
MPVYAAYENTHTNTGDQIEDLIQIAETQLGYCPESEAKYNIWNGMIADSYEYAWCHTFVSWCADQAGIDTSIIPKTESVTAGMGFFTKNKRWMDSQSRGGDYTPRRGDFVYFGQAEDTIRVTHVAIVTGVEGENLYTIEGNVSNQVLEMCRNLTSENILGYGCPLYADYPNLIVPDAPEVTVDVGSSNEATVISWTASEYAVCYTVHIWNTETGEEVVSYTKTGGTCGYQVQLDTGSYVVQVTAENGDNKSPSVQQEFTVEYNPYPLSFLANVYPGTSAEPTRLSWMQSVSAEDYRVFIYNSDTGEEAASTLSTGGELSWEVQLDAGNYWAQVVAVRGEYETKSSQMTFQVEYALPVAVDITITPGTFDTPTEITWTEAENAVDYEIVICRTEPCYNIENADPFCGEPIEGAVYQKTVVCVDETTNGSCSWSGILPEGRYEVTVYSINIVGDKANSWGMFRIIPPLLGDLDFDDVLTDSDARMLQQFLTGEISFSHYGYFERADLNNDDKINGIDLAMLRQAISSQN